MIKVFLPSIEGCDAQGSKEKLMASPLVSSVEIIDANEIPLKSTAMMRKIALMCDDCEYALLYTNYNTLSPCYMALERFVQIAQDTQAGMLYSDYYSIEGKKQQPKPTIDYQRGSLRDDFDFGSVMFFDAAVLRLAAASITDDYQAAGLYALRLAISRIAPIVHVNEYLYVDAETDNRKSGEKLFDYVDPRNRQSQIEMEHACTVHLKAINGYLAPTFRDVDLRQGEFPVEASVIIPVRNRVRTIRDAVDSALMQKTNFEFNVIVVDNHSTDGTAEALASYTNPRLIVINTQMDHLGIGGCWNQAINDARCGRFAVQLDSDDVYSDEGTLQKVVDAFYAQNCAMVVGTYMLTNFDKKPIPPGVIDHKEWTPDNGRNNALRINGLGAPRAFFTSVVRKIQFPNTSYGEDYAMGLAISRYYQIGRIYDVLYLCRRWEDNSDGALDIAKLNANNLYKDRIRTWELQARIALNEDYDR